MLFILVPIWIFVVYLIGNAVQQKSRYAKISKRIALSAFCSFLTIMIFPVCSWIYDVMKWNHFHLGSFLRNLQDTALWIMFAVHFFAFWAGEEIGYAKDKSDDNENV